MYYMGNLVIEEPVYPCSEECSHSSCSPYTHTHAHTQTHTHIVTYTEHSISSPPDVYYSMPFSPHPPPAPAHCLGYEWIHIIHKMYVNFTSRNIEIVPRNSCLYIPMVKLSWASILEWTPFDLCVKNV